MEMHRTDCCSFCAIFCRIPNGATVLRITNTTLKNLMLIKSVYITVEFESFADLYDTWRHQQYVVAHLFIAEEFCSPLRIKKRTCHGYT